MTMVERSSAKWRARLAAILVVVVGTVPVAVGTPANADPGPLSVVAEDSSVGGIPFGAVPIEDIPLTVLEALPGMLPAAPLGSIPLGSIPLGSIPLGSIPLGSIPLGSIPLGSIPLGSIPLGSIGGWEAVLAEIPELDRPALTVTLGELLAYIQANPGSPVAAIQLGELDLSDTPLGSISIASLALGPLPLGSIALDGEAATEADRMALWCAALADLGLPCAPDGPIVPSSTLLTLDVLGAPLGSIPLGSIPLGSIPLGSIPLGSIPLGSIPLGSIPLGSIPLGSIPLGSIPLGSIPLGSIPLGSIDLVADCSMVDCAAGTLADAQAAGALIPLDLAGLVAALGDAGIDVLFADLDGGWPPDVTFGDLLMALIDPADYPWEDLPLADLGLQQWVSDFENANQGSVLFTATFGTTGPATFTDAELRFELPGNFRFVRADPLELSFTPALPGPEPEPIIDGPQMRIPLASVPAGTEVSASVRITPGIEEGVAVMTATLAADGYEASTELEVETASNEEDFFDGDPDSPFFQVVLEPDTLYFKTSGAGDVDYFHVAAPPVGHRLSVHVGGLGGDEEVGLFRLTPGTPLAGEPNPLGIGGTPQSEQAREGAGDAGSLTGDPAGELLDDGTQLVDLSDRDGLGGEEVSVISTGDTTEYLVRVTGGQQVEGKPGYMIRARYVPIAPETTCPARVLPFAGEGTPAALPATLPAGANTVFLVNGERLGDSYGSAEQVATMAALTSLAGRADLGVIGAVVGVEGDPAVAAAYDAWDANPCSTAGANAAVTAIGALLESLVASSPGAAETLESVVLVGADDLLPMARVPDLTRVANESSYAGDLRTAAGDATPLSAAAETRHLLTDDPYGDLDPIPWLDRFLYVPDRAVGRLIEHPTEIRAALSQFEASGGVLDASTALTTGYDFLTDGADAVDAGLARRLPEGQRTTLNPETWDAADLDRALFPDSGPAPAIASVNAHYDHNRLLPGVEPPHGDEVLYRTDEVAARGPAGMVGRLLFTMGCHGGTSVPDIYVGTTDPDRLDWAQLVAGSGGSYVGNTGYGYGDTLSVALSERIMALYAERLDGNATVGRALTDAKQVYLGQLGAYSNYDEKAMMQTTFYGLPMYRIGPPTAPPLPTPPPAPATAVDPETGLVAASLTIAPALEEVTAPDGTTFVRADGQEPQVSADRPLIPRTARTFATGDVPMRGALITSLESTIESGVANSVARPVVDDADNEPANRYDDVAFPSQLVTVNHYRTSTGDEQSLVLLAGRFVTDDDPSTPNGTGDRELFTDVGLTTYFSDDPDDRRPVIQPLATELGAGTATFTVLSYDLDEVDDFEVSRRVLVLYRVPGGQWTSLDLAPTDEITWSGTGSIPSAATAVEWFVQAVDGAGNVGTHTDRGRMLQRSATAPVVDAGPDLTVRLGEPLERSVTVTDADSTRFTGTVDWGNGPQPAEVDGTTLRLSGLATRLGTSTAEVRVCDDGGSCATDQFEVDVLDPDADVVAPVVTGTPDRPANANGWYRAPVTIDWQAVDPAPSSGPPTQPAPSVVETEGAAVEVTSEPSCDPLGNCATGTAVVAMDRTAPGATITSGLLAPLRLLGGRFTGTATDGLSGVDSVTVTYQAIAGGATTQVTATRSCDATGRSCSWSAALPGTGLYKATATVLDRAGNVRSVATTLTIVLL